jgi:hypothetical protein
MIEKQPNLYAHSWTIDNAQNSSNCIAYDLSNCLLGMYYITVLSARYQIKFNSEVGLLHLLCSLYLPSYYKCVLGRPVSRWAMASLHSSLSEVEFNLCMWLYNCFNCLLRMNFYLSSMISGGLRHLFPMIFNLGLQEKDWGAGQTAWDCGAGACG